MAKDKQQKFTQFSGNCTKWLSSHFASNLYSIEHFIDNFNSGVLQGHYSYLHSHHSREQEEYNAFKVERKKLVTIHSKKVQ